MFVYWPLKKLHGDAPNPSIFTCADSKFQKKRVQQEKNRLVLL